LSAPSPLPGAGRARQAGPIHNVEEPPGPTGSGGRRAGGFAAGQTDRFGERARDHPAWQWRRERDGLEFRRRHEWHGDARGFLRDHPDLREVLGEPDPDRIFDWRLLPTRHRRKRPNLWRPHRLRRPRRKLAKRYSTLEQPNDFRLRSTQRIEL